MELAHLDSNQDDNLNRVACYRLHHKPRCAVPGAGGAGLSWCYAGLAGFEPATLRLATAHSGCRVSPAGISGAVHLPRQSDALPLRHRPMWYCVEPGGFEPPLSQACAIAYRWCAAPGAHATPGPPQPVRRVRTAVVEVRPSTPRGGVEGTGIEGTESCAWGWLGSPDGATSVSAAGTSSWINSTSPHSSADPSSHLSTGTHM